MDYVLQSFTHIMLAPLSESDFSKCFFFTLQAFLSEARQRANAGKNDLFIYLFIYLYTLLKVKHIKLI